MSAFAVRLPKYLAAARVSARDTTTYFSNLVADGAMLFLRIWIFYQLYATTYAATGITSINGFSVAKLIWSLMIVQALHRSAAMLSTSKNIEDEVKDGTIAYTLNRPYSYLLFNFARFIGRVFTNVWVNLAVGTATALVFVGPVPISPQSLLAALPILLGGMVITFLLSVLVGLSAFWAEDVSGYRWLYHRANLILGGSIIPPALFPEGWRGIVEATPFAQQYYASSLVLLDFSSGLFIKFVLIQIFWILVLTCFAVGLYKIGERRVVQNGG